MSTGHRAATTMTDLATDDAHATPDAARLPERGRFLPPKTLPFYDRLSGRIIIGLLCSSIVFVAFNFGGVKTAVRYLASAVIHLGGDPLTDKGGIIDKLEHKIDEVKKPHLPLAQPGMVPLPAFGHKSPEQLKLEAELKEAERQRRVASEITSLLARASVVKLDCDKDWPLEKLRVEVPLAEHRAAEEVKKKPILERADKIGLKPDPSLDAKTLRQQVEDAEKELAADADYQAQLREWERAMAAYERRLANGPNARCPHCRNTFRTRADPKHNLKCLRCGTQFSVGKARAFWSPPPPPKKPLPPKKNPGLLWRIFH